MCSKNGATINSATTENVRSTFVSSVPPTGTPWTQSVMATYATTCTSGWQPSSSRSLPFANDQKTSVHSPNTFLVRSPSEFGRATPSLTTEAWRAIEAHRWPGNVRELRNVIERAVIMTEGAEVGVDALNLPVPAVEIRASGKGPLIPPPTDVAAAPVSVLEAADPGEKSTASPAAASAPRLSGPPRKISRPSMIAFRASRLPLKLEAARQETLEAVERRQIKRALEMAQGNKSSAATMLGISRTTLWEKMKHYHLQ